MPAARIQEVLESADLLGFLKQTVSGQLRFHHELRVSVADCPNACSQPQIKDIGVIGACRPRTTDNECTHCEACLEACPEEALHLADTAGRPTIVDDRCIACGKCVAVCPTGTLVAGKTGYRVQLGGKLGRHPRLAIELPGIFDEEAVLAVIRDCLAFYKTHSRDGQRLAKLLKPEDIEHYIREGCFP